MAPTTARDEMKFLKGKGVSATLSGTKRKWLTKDLARASAYICEAFDMSSSYQRSGMRYVATFARQKLSALLVLFVCDGS